MIEPPVNKVENILKNVKLKDISKISKAEQKSL